MSAYYSCFLIAGIFALVASQHKEHSIVYLIWMGLSLIWMLKGILFDIRELQ